jgi:hypothetical protein
MGNLVDGLGHKNLVDYVLKNSTLKKDEFVFAIVFMLGGDGYAHFLVAQDNKIIDLGEFYYDRFIGCNHEWSGADVPAISKFLNLCIQKITDPSIKVPILTGNPDMWDKYYKE